MLGNWRTFLILSFFSPQFLASQKGFNGSSTSSIPLPLSTATMDDGNRVVVVNAEGDRVKLACVNWYGAHMEGHVVNGLDKQTISSIASTIKSLGFNCIRLPFSLEQFFMDPVVEVTYDPTSDFPATDC